MASDYAYETSGPQWVDFVQVMTLNHDNQSSDEFFDRSHDSLEAMPIRQKSRTRKSVRLQNTKGSSTVGAPKIKDVDESKLQSTFMNDIDNMCITPLKLKSPNTMNKEGVLKEYDVNEILTDTMAKLKLASSIKKRPKPQIMNKTACPKIEITPDTPARRKICLSKSLHDVPSNNQNQDSNNQTPVDKARNARRSVRIQSLNTAERVNTPNKGAKGPLIIKKNENEVRTMSSEVDGKCENLDDEVKETFENVKENIESGNKIVNNKKNLRTSVCLSSLQNAGTNSVKKKIRLSRSMHQSTSITRTPVFNLRTSPCTMNLKPSKIPVYKLDDEVDKDLVIVKKMESKNEVPDEKNGLPIANGLEKKSENKPELINFVESDEDNYNEEELPNINEVKEDQVINVPDMEPLAVDTEMNKEEFQPFDQFSKTLDEEDENQYKICKSRYAEERLRAMKKPTILVGQARRNSIQMKNIVNRRRPNKYVSLAEGVKAFQRSTPTRFHTISKNTDKSKQPGPSQKNAQQALKRTIPVSPNWHSRLRIKKVELQQENEKTKNLKKKTFVNPVPTSMLAAPKPLKEVPKKPITVPKPFKLSQPKKNTAPSTSSSSTASSTAAPQVKVSRPNKVMVRNVNSHAGEIQEILHFSIPVTRDFNISSKLEPKKKTTQPVPFHFEERSKKLSNQKKQKLKKLQEEKAKIKAQPAPNAAKKSANKDCKGQRNQKGNSQKISSHIKVVPFSFEERDKLMAKKKEELRKKIAEEEKKVRVFHANPVPHFKPVTVKVPSRENLNVNKINLRTKSVENLKSKNNISVPSIPRGLSADHLMKRSEQQDSKKIIQTRQSPAAGSSTSSNVSQNNQENRVPNMPVLKPKLKPLPIELHSDKRARLRREYEEKVKRKMEQEEALRRREQEINMAREQEEIARMRRQAEHKARPVPVYKPLAIAKSTKPITEPQSPAWAQSRR